MDPKSVVKKKWRRVSDYTKNFLGTFSESSVYKSTKSSICFTGVRCFFLPTWIHCPMICIYDTIRDEGDKVKKFKTQTQKTPLPIVRFTDRTFVLNSFPLRPERFFGRTEEPRHSSYRTFFGLKMVWILV